MILGNVAIVHEMFRGSFSITPWQPESVGPASIDLHLDKGILVYQRELYNPPYKLFDAKRPNHNPGADQVVIPEQYGYVISPGSELVLGCTIEELRLGPTLAARVEGKSSLGRQGLMVHVTAGFIDPGYHGQVTLELYSTVADVVLYPGMPIAQLSLHRVDGCTVPYDGKYQGSRGPQPSAYQQNWDATEGRWLA